MAETHRQNRSALRVTFFSTLLLGALTLLGMAVLPQQFAHAAATPYGAAEKLDPAKPKVKVVNCVADPRVDAIFTICERIIAVADRVSVTRWLPYKNEDETIFWKKCEYVFKADFITTLPDGASGFVLAALGDACKDFQISVGSRGTVYGYRVGKIGGGKGNGKPKK